MLRRLFCVIALCATSLSVAGPLLAQDMPLSQILIDGENWKLVAEGYKFTEGPAVDAEGNLYFVDVPTSKIIKVDTKTGSVTDWVTDSGKASGLMFGSDGRLYACQSANRQVVAYDNDAKPTVIATDLDVNDLVVSRKGDVYVTDYKNSRVWHISPDGKKQMVDEGIAKPNGIILWPDEQTLVVSDNAGGSLWTFRVKADGTLEHKQPYYTLELGPQDAPSQADGMTVDVAGRLHVATSQGLQVFDSTGRLAGILLKPQPKFLSNVAFAGEQLDTLYVTCADKVYSRKLKTQGISNQHELPATK